MEFKFHMGTKAFFGVESVLRNKGEFLKYGRHAFIVCGKSSAYESGALKDVIAVLEENDINYNVYDSIENNPSLENVSHAGRKAAEFQADFIIGIGGGSPLDASKAVAVLAVNKIDPLELFKNKFDVKPLPIIAIPTTAGTGSEVTPYSILTRSDVTTKMSFGNEDTFPRASFLDPRYTQSMKYETTVNTAIDAFSHALEGYITKRSTPASDIIAKEAIRIFGECIKPLSENEIDISVREKLLYMSMLAGMVISQTGTTILHGMGYSLTYFKDIPHGMANGLLMYEYLRFNYDVLNEKIDNILSLLGFSSLEEFGKTINSLLKYNEKISDEEIMLYTDLSMKQKSLAYNIKGILREDVEGIFKRSLAR